MSKKLSSDAESIHNSCKSSYLKKFNDYHNAMTVVAGWNVIFETDKFLKKINFYDWFPSLPAAQNQERKLTPDSAALFNDNHGMIFEIKAGFPNSDDLFDKELDQIKNYDLIDRLNGKDGKQHLIKTKDIVILLDSFCPVDQITKRIMEKLANKGHSFKLSKSNLIVMEYGYKEGVGQSFFVMKRSAIKENGAFQDLDLYEHLVENLKPINIKPDLFKDYLSKYMVMNDQPPVIFTLVFLWDKGLYKCLNKEQLEDISNNKTFKFEIELSPQQLVNMINAQIFQQGIFNIAEIREALDALKDIGLAKFDKESQKYLVTFKDLRRISKRGEMLEDKRNVQMDLAEFFASELCLARIREEIRQKKDEKQLFMFPENDQAVDK